MDVGENPIVERGICGKGRVLLSLGIYRLGPDSSPWAQNDKAGGGRLGDTEDLVESWHLPAGHRFFALWLRITIWGMAQNDNSRRNDRGDKSSGGLE
jgi:hypothetical protein